jgi:hypothetical protein
MKRIKLTVLFSHSYSNPRGESGLFSALCDAEIDRFAPSQSTRPQRLPCRNFVPLHGREWVIRIGLPSMTTFATDGTVLLKMVGQVIWVGCQVVSRLGRESRFTMGSIDKN